MPAGPGAPAVEARRVVRGRSCLCHEHVQSQVQNFSFREIGPPHFEQVNVTGLVAWGVCVFVMSRYYTTQLQLSTTIST